LLGVARAGPLPERRGIELVLGVQVELRQPRGVPLLGIAPELLDESLEPPARARGRGAMGQQVERTAERAAAEQRPERGEPGRGLVGHVAIVAGEALVAA